jgi:hypothetical protein
MLLSQRRPCVYRPTNVGIPFRGLQDPSLDLGPCAGPGCGNTDKVRFRAWLKGQQSNVTYCRAYVATIIRRVLDRQLDLLDHKQLHTSTMYTLRYSLLQLELCC